MGELIVAEFFQCLRCRCQRLSDSKIFNGWVVLLQQTTFKFNCNKLPELKTGDRLRVEVFGTETKSSFEAEICSKSVEDLTTRITTPIETKKSVEPARVVVKGVEGSLIIEGESKKIKVMDVSDTGLGAISEFEVKKGSKVQFEIRRGTALSVGNAEVRYCRNEPTAPNKFRVGLRITEMSRLDRARLVEIFQNPAAQAA